MLYSQLLGLPRSLGEVPAISLPIIFTGIEAPLFKV